MKQIRIYQSANGKQPFTDWMKKLKDKTAMAQVNNRIRRLSIGQRGDFKRVGSGVYELRIHYGPGYRVYFSEYKGAVVLLLLGGDKGTQKKDIKQAISYWEDFKEQYREQS